MYKFFSILVINLFSFVSVNAQASVEQQSFLAKAFPKDMPAYVLKNTEVVPVTKKYAKRHNDIYLHDDLNGGTYPGYIREGDTLLVFKGTPYFSTGQKVFMTLPPVQEITKARKAKKSPRTAEEKAQDQQMIMQGVNILTNVVLPRVIGNNATQIGGTQKVGAYWQ